MRRWPIGALATLFLAGAALAQDAPRRVVSMNLCTDQLAMLLADEGQLVSVSRIAADPHSSPVADRARSFPLNAGGAEEIVLMRPDLVLAADWSDPVAVRMLRGLGIEVVEVPIATRLSDIPDGIRSVGRALGRSELAETMARAAEARLAALPGPRDDAPVAAFYYANGYTLGSGTLGHDILRSAGFANLAERLGRAGGGRLSLETIVVEAPDLLVTSRPYAGASEAEAVARHPALRPYRDAGRIILSGPEWVCGTPFTLDAVERMADPRLRRTFRQ